MTADVPSRRAAVRYQEIKAGAPVRGPTFRQLTKLLHWCHARGMQIVPAHYSGAVVIDKDNTLTLSYRVEPSGTAIARVWHLTFFNRATNQVDAVVTAPSNSAATFILPPSTAGPHLRSSYVYIEYLTAKSATETTITLDIDTTHPTADGPGVDIIGCWELPRAVLAEDTTDYGVDLESLRFGLPMADLANQSVHAVAELAAQAKPRRVLWAMYHQAAESTAATWEDVYELPLCPNARELTGTAGTVTADWHVFAYCDSGTAGEVRVSTNAGTTSATSVTATTQTLHSGTCTLETEDPTEDDGLAASTWEAVDLQVQRTSGTGNVYITGFCGWVGA